MWLFQNVGRGKLSIINYSGGTEISGGIVMGTRAPIILTSRADSAASRVASAALACLLVHHRRAVLPESGR